MNERKDGSKAERKDGWMMEGKTEEWMDRLRE